MNPLEQLANVFREPWYGQDKLVFDLGDDKDTLKVSVEIDAGGEVWKLDKGMGNISYRFNYREAKEFMQNFLPDRPFVPSDPLRE